MSVKVNIDRTGAIVIKVPASTLKRAAVMLPAFEHYDEDSGDFLVPKIKDPKIFAKEVLRTLRSEEEDGTTLVHEMFDKAIEEAVEQGAEDIVFPDDKEYGRKAFSR
ncbi:MAG: hypothetical protein E5V54_22730 [Mesorhizobium sp.]|nr:MAG: hypothetical protein E5V54_22730 [Mesorhizobium sp.]